MSSFLNFIAHWFEFSITYVYDRRILMKAVNWNTQEDMTNMFWRQNISQMWVETEFKVSKDIASWKTLSDSEKETFKKALAGLTGLDTHQADDGMPLIMLHTTDLRKKAVYSFMACLLYTSDAADE